MNILLIYRFSHLLFEKRILKNVKNRLTRHSRSGKHGRLGHVIGTREMSRGRSVRSFKIQFIWFLSRKLGVIIWRDSKLRMIRSVRGTMVGAVWL